MCGSTLQRRINREGGAVENVQACLNSRKDVPLWRSSADSANLFMWGKHPTTRRGGVVKHVQAGLSARKDGESSFLQCGGPVKLVQTCFCAENTL